MIDLKLVREQPEFVRKNLEKRGNPKVLLWFDKLRELDILWRKDQFELQQFTQQKNSINQEIAQLKKQGKDIQHKLLELQRIPQHALEKQTSVDLLKKELDDLWLRIPNLIHNDVPLGTTPQDAIVVRTFGKKNPAPAMSHVELAEKLNLADFEKSGIVSGNGFYYLKGALSLLNLGIIQYVVHKLVKKGYTPIEPPLMLNRKSYEGATDLSAFEDMLYKIEGEDKYLIATSEHPIAAMLRDETIAPEKLPLKFAGISPCFRKEIGSHGIDEKGLFRRHQFSKVEQFVYCTPEDANRYHEEMLANAEEIFTELNIPFRTILLCSGDMGRVASKQYDIEAWMPRTQDYKEVVSGSNCTDYQARRLNIKYGKEGGKKEYVYTLNCTAIATSRALVAILENYQNEDGSVTIPSVLQKYVGLKKISALPQPKIKKIQKK